MTFTESEVCPLCSRPLAGKCSRHHLVPKAKGGAKGETVLMHHICHTKIHSLFTEREIQTKYNTIEKLLQNGEIQLFVKWLANKPNDFYVRSSPRKR